MPRISRSRSKLSATLAPELLQAKLEQPSVPNNGPMVSRSRLIEPLLNADWQVLTVIAPSGYGKTVFLFQLTRALAVASEDFAIAWLQLDPMDRDPLRFLRYLGHALAKAGLLTQDSIGWEETVKARETVAELTDALVSRIQPQCSGCIVLDGIQELCESDEVAVLGNILRYIPSTLRVMQAGRRMPVLGLGSAWSDARYPLLGVLELSMRADEALEMLGSGTELGAAELTSSGLLERLRGWPAGIEMLCRQGGDRRRLLRAGGTDELPIRYFDEMIAALPDDRMRDDLLSLSVTGVANGELMSAVFGGEDWPQRLEKLGDSGALAYRDRRPGWYLLHPWLADYLRAHFQSRNPDALRKANLSAATWLAGRGYPVHAVRQALMARQGELAMGFIHACLDDVIDQGHLEQVKRWRQALPDSYLRRFPMVIVMWGWEMLFEGRLQDARLLSESVEPALDKEPVKSGAGGVQVELGRALGLRAVVAVMMGDDGLLAETQARWEHLQLPVEQACGLAMLALGQGHLLLGRLEPAEACLRAASRRQSQAGSHLLGVLVDYFRAQAMLDSGQLEAASRLSRLSTEEIERPWIRAMVGSMASLAAWRVAYERNQLEGLADCLDGLLGNAGRLPATVCAEAAVLGARVFMAQGQAELAEKLLTDVSSGLSKWAPEGFARLSVRVEEIRLQLRLGATDRALRMARDAGLDLRPESGQEQVPVRQVMLLEVGARLALASGRAADGVSLLDIALATLPEWMTYGRARLLALKALSLAECGNEQESDELIAVLLEQGRQVGLSRLFLDEGAPMHARLKAFTDTRHLDGEFGDAVYVDGLMTAFSAQQRVKAKEEDLQIEKLTDRELQILQMVEKGSSNQEISERLYLSLGTVKWHLHNVYEKLLVRNRTQAIHRAQEAGLL